MGGQEWHELLGPSEDDGNVGYGLGQRYIRIIVGEEGERRGLDRELPQVLWSEATMLEMGWGLSFVSP